MAGFLYSQMTNLKVIGLLLFLGLQWGCSGTEQKQQSKKPSSKTAESAQKASAAASNSKDKFILFFGNSLTAGYGLKEGQAFTDHIQNRLDSLGENYKVINAGLSGETTAGGKNRINWVLRQPVDIFVLELGGNDMLRGLPFEETEKNLRSIFEQVREKKPEAKLVLTGMMAAPNLGPEYAKGFNAVYPKLAKEFNAAFVPFLLEGVAGISKLNQADGIHPTAKGQEIVAENVWKVLREVVE